MIYKLRKFRGLPIWALVLLAGLWGCQMETAVITMPETTAIVPTVTAVIQSTSPPTLPPTPPPLPTSSPVPSSTVSPTPRPLVILAVPPEWATAAETAVTRLQNMNWQWQIIPVADSTRQLANGAAQMAIVPGETTPIVYQEPIALAVPFITNWEAIDLAQAQAILTNGHALVQPMNWSDLTPDWKALRVDGRHPTDPDYPFQNQYILAAAPGFEPIAAELTALLYQSLREETVSITAVGDMMLSRDLGNAIQQGDLAFPFAKIIQLLQASDLTVGNLETALGNIGEPAAKRYPFISPPDAAKSLALAGFDIITLANNHAMDYGPDALQQGINLLHEQQIATVGAGSDEEKAFSPHLAQINGLKLAFLGYVNVPVEASTGFDTQTWTAVPNAPGLAWGDPERIFDDVTAVAPQVDLTIVLLHSGYEYIEEPSEIQAAAAHAAIDAGADLVIGHHAHILQGVEFYKDGVIVYGLGNFAFDITGPPETAVLNVWLDKNGVRQLELMPAIIQETGQPRPAEPEEVAVILERVHFLTMLLNANKE